MILTVLIQGFNINNKTYKATLLYSDTIWVLEVAHMEFGYDYSCAYIRSLVSAINRDDKYCAFILRMFIIVLVVLVRPPLS